MRGCIRLYNNLRFFNASVVIIQSYHVFMHKVLSGFNICRLIHGINLNHIMQHDVFLIFNNAMNFNSSGTVYFRQVNASEHFGANFH
jgi:hypothetical protein